MLKKQLSIEQLSHTVFLLPLSVTPCVQVSDGLAVVLMRRVHPVVVEFPPLLCVLPAPLILFIIFLFGIVLKLVPLLFVKLSPSLVCGQDLPLFSIYLILRLSPSSASTSEEV